MVIRLSTLASLPRSGYSGGAEEKLYHLNKNRYLVHARVPFVVRMCSDYLIEMRDGFACPPVCQWKSPHTSRLTHGEG